MQALSFDELFAFLSATPLSSTDLARLRDWIDNIRTPAECLALIEEAAAGRPCPRCACARLHRAGFASGLQRYRCLDCRRSFNALTGTPLARLRKRECWLPYIQCLLESRTVRDAAHVAGVHRTTSFRWRHRFAPGAARNRPAALSAIVEADETYRLESQKGSRSLTRAAQTRRRRTAAWHQPRARLPAGGARPLGNDTGLSYGTGASDGGAIARLPAAGAGVRRSAHQ